MRCPAELASRAMLGQGVEAGARRRLKPGGGAASSMSTASCAATSTNQLTFQFSHQPAINLKTAKALDFAVPAAMLVAADKAIRITTILLHCIWQKVT